MTQRSASDGWNGLILPDPCSLSAALFFHVLIYKSHMKCIAMLSKQLRNGSTSTWEFHSNDDDKFLAFNNAGKRIPCRDLADLRRFYKKMLGWGFMPADIAVED